LKGLARMIDENKKTDNKKFKKIFLAIVIVFLILLMSLIPTIIRGYRMYESAIREMSIQEKVLEVRSDASYATLEEISPLFLLGVLESEDQSFYRHKGIDFKSTSRAVLTNLKARKLIEGGSTITQQLAKNLYFTFDKTFERKIAEIFVVRRLENQLSKNDILELYCNIAYFGEGTYGIEEATIFYFNKMPRDLSPDQAKILVKTLKSPSYYNPNTILEDTK
jgi:membrane peptidoglycan carboxypeptidase